MLTVARHRQFRWPADSNIEVAGRKPFAALMEAGELQLLVLDSVRGEHVAVLCGRLLRGASGTLASLRPVAISAVLAHSIDIVVRIGRSRRETCSDGCDWPPHTGEGRKPVTTTSRIWY